MRTRPSIRRNAIIFLCGIALLMGAIVFVRMSGRLEYVIPPEPPDVAAKRQAPENGYFALLEAGRLLPMQKPLPAQRDRGTGGYEALPHSIGALLGIELPDDDPELIAYVKACAAAVAKAQEALAAPYYLEPTRWSDFEDFAGTGLGGASSALWASDLMRAIVAVPAQSFQETHDGEKAIADVLDTLRLSSRLMSDGYGSSLYFSGYTLQREAVYRIPEVAKSLTPAALAGLQAELSKQEDSIPPPVANFEWYVRALDNTRLPTAGTHDWRNTLRLEWWKMGLSRLRRALAKNIGELHSALSLTYPAYKRWEAAQPELRKISRATNAPLDALAVHADLAFGKNLRDAYYRGTRLAVAIVWFHRENQRYPDTLNQLLPKYVSELPRDPFTDGPFLYRVADGGYLLYSAGVNGRDDEGQKLHRKGLDDIIIHRSAAPNAKAG